MTDKTKNTLPALVKGYRTFIMPVDDQVEVSPELAKLIDGDENKTYYEQCRDSFPFISIRQKDLKQGRKVVAPAGGFKYQNVDFDVPDADGEKGIVISILADQDSRVWFDKLTDKKPTCKSNNGVVGMGSPGGQCLSCPLSLFSPEGDAPVCNQQINLFCFDHTITDSNPVYILNIGRSGLKSYGKFKAYLQRVTIKFNNKNMTIPISFHRVLVTTEFVNEKGGYYVPVFKLIDTLELEGVKEVKTLQGDLCDVFKKAVAETDLVETDTNQETELDPDMKVDSETGEIK